MGGESDDASFTFGNADRVMRDLANDVDLYRASIEFSLFHVGHGHQARSLEGRYRQLVARRRPGVQGHRRGWPVRTEPAIPDAQDLAHLLEALQLAACPYSTTARSTWFTSRTPMPLKCDKGYDTPNGCLAHGMKRYYGGDPRRTAGRPDQGQLDRRVGLRAVHAHQRVAGRGFDLRPGDAGGLHRQRHAGELQDGGGPGRERLLRGAGRRGRRPARGVHADSLRDKDGDATRDLWATSSTARRTTATPARPRPSDGAWATIRPARRTGSRSTSPETRLAATGGRSSPATPPTGQLRGRNRVPRDPQVGREGTPVLQARRAPDGRHRRAGIERAGSGPLRACACTARAHQPRLDRDQHAVPARGLRLGPGRHHRSSWTPRRRSSTCRPRSTRPRSATSR